MSSLRVDGDPGSVGWLISMWREDRAVNGTMLQPGFQVVAIHRFGVWSLRQQGLMRWLTSKIYVLAYVFTRNVYGVDLPRRAVVGRRLRLPHPVGVVVHAQAQIGDDCMIRQNVTIGQFNYGRERQPPFAPTLGNRVWVGAGAVIVGGISVGDGARIGPNTVVLTDVPEDGFVFARETSVTGPLLAKNASETTLSRQANPGDGSLQSKQATDEQAVSEFITLIHDVVEPDEPIDEETPLISTGIIDSFDVVALLTAIEDRFGVIIDPEEVDVEWFDTPAQMLNRINASRA